MIEKAVAAYFLALRNMDVEAWVSTFASDAVSHDPVGTAPLVGHDALRGFLTGVLGLFERVGLQEQQIFVAGNEAAIKWAGSGRGKNGRDVEFEGIDVMTVNDHGKIQTVRAYWNAGAVIAAVTS
jgi:steroid delta-isomerase